MTQGFISQFPTVVVAENSRVSVGFVAVRGDVLLPTRVPTHEDTRLGSEAVHTGQELCSVRARQSPVKSNDNFIKLRSYRLG